jgi:WD40 repeat protein
MNSDIRPVFFQAHLHPLAMIRFSPNAALVATASEQGTLIRVFDSASGTLLNVFRRGALQSEVIAIAISLGNQKLVAVSRNGTAHAFRLADRITDDEKAPRAVSKLKLGTLSLVDLMFIWEKKMVIVSSLGICCVVTFQGDLWLWAANTCNGILGSPVIAVI